ncbi:hypothetical protein OHO28_09495 [Streptomyces europaeiscabiei]|uniref:hypothetical protein n=1 Tax=Streptomyces europaeiscabiei TaxID=146819 RepID=UPI002E16D961
MLLATRHGALLASTAAINQLNALIVSAPDELRAELRKLKCPTQIAYWARLRDRQEQDLENEILALVRQQAPELLALLGIGPITAAQILVSWSHQG